MKKHTIALMKKIAMQRKGKCLSNTYTNQRVPLKWQCEKGHVWEARPANVVGMGRWCKECAAERNTFASRHTIDEMRLLAKKRGGRFLSNKYERIHDKYLWECAFGHRWRAAPIGVINGAWCHVCWGKAGDTIEAMHKLAEKMGGQCLSSKYVNASQKLVWQCIKGHVWKATPGPIKQRGVWCPDCRTEKIQQMMREKRHTIEQIRDFASKRNGKLLSTSYANAQQPLLWQCSEGHQWQISYHAIKNKHSWCPVCSSNISEQICRDFFEAIFLKPFPKRRPTWLKNKRGKIMELDGYCETLRLAFEYHGQQHYKKIAFYHPSEKDFNMRRSDDKHKKLLCEQQGITLIEVPYTINYEDMQEYIIDKSEKAGYKDLIKKHIDYTDLAAYVPDRLKKFREIAASKGGLLLSTKYYNAHIKLKWQCSEGHIWLSTPNRIYRGAWCPTCSIKQQSESRRSRQLESLHHMAQERGGKLLSKIYIPREKLKWECEKGHIWIAEPHHIQSAGAWCPTCGVERARKKWKQSNIKKQHHYFKLLQILAEERGGLLLSKEYTKMSDNHLWQCSKGHKWYAKPHNVKINGTWCPKCAHQK